MSVITIGYEVLIRGIVQGVGFRPFVYHLATEHDLTGWVCNSSRGVEIVINGPEDRVRSFLQALEQQAPPLAHIDAVESRPIPVDGYTSFEIRKSQSQPGEFIPISPDVSICPDCQRELFNPKDRRYRYPFINCTNCGPRFTIVRDIPYDRPNTTMADFPMCPDCKAEYENPLDRRFHAQPVACPVCGPQIWYEIAGQVQSRGEDGLRAVRQALKDGKIIAVKGLGGFHLACDATQSDVVAELRRRKKRSDKPFALMVYDLDTLRRHCAVRSAEAELAQSRQRPIVLFERLPTSPIAVEVAPNQQTLGIMLPYTPLHLLLMQPEPGFPEVLVMTSGNASEEPIAYEDQDARERLSSLADGFLMHDRPIHMRVDDSVMRQSAGKPAFARRSRGYVPDPIRLPAAIPPILATGPELKNTFCLTRQEYAFVSHHIGDLENYETLRSFETGIEHFERLFHVRPEILACDLHPDYLATRYAKERSEREGLRLVQVQHHHAHLAACLAENGRPYDEPAIGLSFDGTGYGTDGAIWGGEFLAGDCRSFRRLYHLAYTPLPGGEQAIRKPSRMALAHLWQAGLDWDPDYPAVAALCAEERTVLRAQLDRSLNALPTSSMGRLFDAVSALLGVRQTATYEGQAAMELEALADPLETGSYSFGMLTDIVDPKPVVASLLRDWQVGTPLPVLSARFHNSIVRLCVDLCKQIRSREGLSTVALSGGVWQNQFLLERALRGLGVEGFEVLVHNQLPPNDGSISLGQAVIAAQTVAQPISI